METLSPQFYSATHSAVLVGDAAHACPPMLQQGAALAFEDAIALAILLKQFGLKKGVKYYEEFRKPYVEAISTASQIGIVYTGIPSDEAIAQRNEAIRRDGPINIRGWRKILSAPPYLMSLQEFIRQRTTLTDQQHRAHPIYDTSERASHQTALDNECGDMSYAHNNF